MKRLTVYIILALALSGCASTPRGNAENACNFAFLAALPLPVNQIIAAAVCTFGLELLPDTECPEGDEECEEDTDV